MHRWHLPRHPRHHHARCPVTDFFNVTARIADRAQAGERASSTGGHRQFTFALTSHTVRLDWVHVHLLINATQHRALSDGSYPMTRAVHAPRSTWEYRIDGALLATERVEYAFTFHVHGTRCETHAHVSDLDSLLHHADLITPDDLIASAHEHVDDEHIHAELSAVHPIDTHQHAHSAAAVQHVWGEGSVDQSDLPHAHPQHAAVSMDAYGNVAPAYLSHAYPTDAYHTLHPHAYASSAFAPFASASYADHIDSHPHPQSHSQASGEQTLHGEVGAAAVCDANDYSCQVREMCHACFSYEQPALCAPCAAVMRCEDHLCSHRAVSLMIPRILALSRVACFCIHLPCCAVLCAVCCAGLPSL